MVTGALAWLRRRASVIYLTALVFGGFGGSYWLSVHTSASVVQLCQLGNESRAQQVGLWEYIIHISRPPPHETPAARAQRLATVRQFDAHLHKVFAPRNCAERLK